MTSSTEDLIALSSILSSNINTYLERLSATTAPPPTLKPAPPLFLKDEAGVQAKDEIIRACEKIIALVQAPFESMVILALAWHETGALRVALEMKLHEHIPLGGDISLDELAKKVGGSKDLILRVLRALANRNCFAETSPSHYTHTAISATLTVPPLNALVGHSIEDAYNSGPHLADVVRENNFAVPDDASKTAFNKAFKTDKPFFDYIYSDPDTSRAERFGLGMKAMSMMGHFPQNTYTPLQTLPAGSVVCDVGGGLGQAAISMAQTCPGPKFIVQDQEMVIIQGRDENCPKELSHRIEYQAMDFFKEQPVKGADIYYLRHILHDHPDQNCRRILSHIVAVMDPNKSRILLDELLLPEEIGPDQKRLTHLRDFQMLVLCNSAERTENQWRALLKSVDERLFIEKIWESPDSLAVGSSPILECRLRA